MTHGAFATELGRRLVEKVAPDESAMFEQTWKALERRSGRRGTRRSEPLGFGLPEAGAVLVTAVVSGVLTTVIEDLAKQFGSRWGRALARLRGRPKELLPDPLPPLPASRLEEIRRIAYKRARKLGLSEDRASALADALVSELAIGGPDS
ncbi:hypothetical protein [Nonomuraea guangzhouensis]|uniref:Uncharacterized protein n=1 Tax=Nonomuraea guangzhouensis TaxID=1291555 RepID=A0ABW4GV67_9ACTN|nr:hypothetical protein [Nonomuraea guangzhouensis]